MYLVFILKVSLKGVNYKSQLKMPKEIRGITKN